MKVMLTSSLGGSTKENGIRVPSILIQRNGLLDNLKSIWITESNVLIICADPSDHEKNDSVCACLKKSLPMSGLSISHIDKCDDRNPNAVDALESIDVLILAGGHVPTQNRFMDQLRLRERLKDYHGIVVAWSAGSMNCADTVYAGPELEGEAIDPLYERWITGLGLTDINIFPHFQSLKDDYLDGMRLIVVKKLVEKYDGYALSISATTREPRPGEVDGREYFFLKKAFTSCKIMIRVDTNQHTELLFFKIKIIRIFTNRRYPLSNTPFIKSFRIFFCTDP